MSAVCTMASGTPSLARDVLASTDCLIVDQIERGYAALLMPNGFFTQALTLGLTVYVALIGYRLVLGQAGLSLAELVPHFIKIGLILALVTRWPSYQVLVLNLLYHGPEQIADPIVRQISGPGSNQGDVMMSLQAMFDRLTEFASAAWSEHSAEAVSTANVHAPLSGSVPPATVEKLLPFHLGAPQFSSALLWFSALVMMAMSVGVLLVVRIILAILLLFGPVFIAMALFSSTRGLFEGWIKITVKFALVPLITLPLVAALLAVLTPFASALSDAPIDNIRDGPVLIILLITMVFAAVMLQATRLAAGISGSIQLPKPYQVGQSALNPTAPRDTHSAIVLPSQSRAEQIVRTLHAGGGRHVISDGSTPAAAMLATRQISGSVIMMTRGGENSARLGQSYRRLPVSNRAASSLRKGGLK